MPNLEPWRRGRTELGQASRSLGGYMMVCMMHRSSTTVPVHRILNRAILATLHATLCMKGSLEVSDDTTITTGTRYKRMVSNRKKKANESYNKTKTEKRIHDACTPREKGKRLEKPSPARPFSKPGAVKASTPFSPAPSRTRPCPFWYRAAGRWSWRGTSQ